MVIIVTITIDTEADHRGDGWVKTDPLEFRSVTDGIPDKLTPLMRGHGARPTYLLTTEVMHDPKAVEVLRSTPLAELGTHLHGDHVQPNARVPNPAGSKSWDFTSHYPEAIERAKLETITKQFETQFGARPRSYRAGRYAASGRTASLLSQLGYLVDTSVTPGVRWVNEIDPGQVLDFRRAPLFPYRPSAADLSRQGDVQLWEIPITIVPRPMWWDLGVSAAQTLLRRPRASYPAWLRPSTTSWAWLKWIVMHRLAAPSPDPRLFNIMFHSMEVTDGASPYSPTRRAADTVLARLDRLLALFESLGARFMTLSELSELLDAGAWHA